MYLKAIYVVWFLWVLFVVCFGFLILGVHCSQQWSKMGSFSGWLMFSRIQIACLITPWRILLPCSWIFVCGVQVSYILYYKLIPRNGKGRFWICVYDIPGFFQVTIISCKDSRDQRYLSVITNALEQIFFPKNPKLWRAASPKSKKLRNWLITRNL